MFRIRPLARVAFLFLPLLLFAEGKIQPAVPQIEWTDLPAVIVEKSPDLKTGYLVVPERRFPARSGRATTEI